MTPRLVLASTSPYRRELLDRLGLVYEAVAPRCDERAMQESGAPPEVVAGALARAKADSVAGEHPGAWILGSDQLVDLDGALLGKPGSREAAVEQLARLAGREHRLLTAVALRAPDGTHREALDVHVLRMRRLAPDALARYVAHDDPVDCAGAYKIERGGIALFEAIRGDDFTAIMGLPLLTVVRLLGEAGFVVP